MNTRRFFGLALASNMLPDGTFSRETITPERVKGLLAEGYTSCVNPHHKTTLEALSQRFEIDVEVPERPPMVSLKVGEELIVMSARFARRLAEGERYSEEEVQNADFSFVLYKVES